HNKADQQNRTVQQLDLQIIQQNNNSMLQISTELQRTINAVQCKARTPSPPSIIPQQQYLCSNPFATDQFLENHATTTLQLLRMHCQISNSSRQNINLAKPVLAPSDYS
ncbi:unnamed protein product, partial [Ilex paraguariensis]